MGSLLATAPCVGQQSARSGRPIGQLGDQQLVAAFSPSTC